MRQLIAGNWKMHGLSAGANELAAGLRMGSEGLQCDLLVCPPFVHVQTVSYLLADSGIAVGGQDCHPATQGAHTGEVSGAMLADLGCRYVIIGHSERRQNHAETDALVRAKTLAAIAAGLIPIVCVGEIEADRMAGRETEIVGAQLAGSLPEGFAGVVAYEPVWAIGTGRTPTEADVAAMHAFIRASLVRQFGRAGQGVLILYGGSVKPSNAAVLLAIPDVGGALVGGASLIAEDFLGIARAAKAG